MNPKLIELASILTVIQMRARNGVSSSKDWQTIAKQLGQAYRLAQSEAVRVKDFERVIKTLKEGGEVRVRVIKS